MATVIETGPGRFIVGDAAVVLPDGHDWCGSCAGDGLEYGWDDELQVCLECSGSGTLECADTACRRHSTLHPEVAK